VSGGFCPTCGRARGADDRYCSGCGRLLDTSTQSLAVAETPVVSQGSATARARARRPWWQWAALAVGAFVVGLSALRALPAQQAPPPTSVPSTATAVAPTATANAPTAAAVAPTAVPTPRAAPTIVVSGQVAPVGQAPAPTATATLVFYRGEPFGPVKIEPRAVQPVRLNLAAGTRVVATLTVTFNNRLSNVSGTPDLDVLITGPGGTLATYPMARNGFQLAFQAPAAGDYTIVLNNERSRVNAKQVGLQFLQP
jgi:hypothetical protein